MRVLVIESDERIQTMYKKVLSRVRQDQVDVLHPSNLFANNPYTRVGVLGEVDVKDYDVVIVDKEKTKTYLTNIPWERVVVASSHPSPHNNGSWGITKPFHMEELLEILDTIRDSSLQNVSGSWKQVGQ